jgi:hypothetical protein
MSDSKNGKTNNGKEKEIDRLLKLIDAIARIDTKVSAFSEEAKILRELLADQYKIDITDIRERLDSIDGSIFDAEKRRNELIQTVADLQKSFDKWKIYWSIIAFIGAPIVTTVVIWSIEHFILHQW